MEKSVSLESLRSPPEGEGGSGEKVFQSLLDQMKHGVFGPEVSSAMPEPEVSIPVLSEVVSRLNCEDGSQDGQVETFDAEELLIMLNEDRSQSDRFHEFADDMRQVIQKIGEDKVGCDSFDSLLSEPVGEWEDDAFLGLVYQQ